jgi:ATP-dependent helicase/DNAse subunit B
MARVTVFLDATGGPWPGRERLVEALSAGRPGRALVATYSLAEQLRQEVVLRGPLPGLFGNPICTFYNLARQIAVARFLGTKDISDTGRALLLEALAREAATPSFARVQRFPGFARALGNVIGELKLAMIHPADLEAAWLCHPVGMGNAIPEGLPKVDGRLRAKLADILTLYRAYQERLAAGGLHDAEGLMWHAVSALEAAPDLLGPLDLLVVDGFHRFSRVQLRLLRAQADNASEILLRLPCDEGRPDLFASSLQTLAELKEMFDVSVEVLDRAGDDGDLGHLRRYLFAAGTPRRPSDGRLSLLGAASPSAEADLVAREVVRLRREGRAYSDMLIVCRGREVRDRFADALDRRGVPLRKPPENAVGDSVVGRTLRAALRVMRDGWRTEDVGAVLKAPILGADPLAAAGIEFAAWERGLREGRREWLAPWGDSSNLRASLLAPVAALEDRLRSAENAAAMAAAVTEFLGKLRLPEDDPLDWGDAVRAREAVFDALNELTRIAGLVGPTSLDDFVADLLRLLAETTYRPGRPPGRSAEGVLVADAQALAGERFPIVFVVDLLERVFPRQLQENAFLRDAERRVLAERGLILDPVSRLRAEERLLFWQAAGAATERLYLTYPTADETARDTLPSFYLDEVRALFETDTLTERVHTVAELIPEPEDALDERDLKAALLHGLLWQRDPEGRALTAGLYNALDRPVIGYLVPAPAYCDALGDDELRARLAGRAIPYHPTELEAYAACPYLYFCQRLLGLSPVRREVDPLDRGSVLHAALRRFYRDLANRFGGPVEIAGLDLAEAGEMGLRALEEELRASSRYRLLPAHRRGAERDRLAAKLTRFLRADLTLTAERGLRPAYFELQFGRSPQGDNDPRSVNEPLDLSAGESPLLIAGKIDRVDLTPDGRGALIIDYKSGRKPVDVRKAAEGLLLQAPLYALAVQQLWGLELVGSEYASIGSGERRGIYREGAVGASPKTNICLPPSGLADLLGRSAEFARRYAAAIAAGKIAVAPAEECRATCSFRGVCHFDAWLYRREGGGGSHA